MTEEFIKICETGPEILLYYTINTLGGVIWRMNHDLADGRIIGEEAKQANAELPRLQEQIQFAVSHAARFGVTTPMNADKTPTPQYKRWFNWWDSYTHSIQRHTEDQLFAHLNNINCTEAEVAEWRPEGDWRTPDEIVAAEAAKKADASSAQN
jgi:hypothetical protein